MEVNTDASAPRVILDQGYSLLDGGKEIGSRRLVVAENDQTPIVKELWLGLTFNGAPLGIVELDVSAVYSVAEEGSARGGLFTIFSRARVHGREPIHG